MIMDEWKMTREQVKNEIYEIDKHEIVKFKKKLLEVSEAKDKANIYLQLSEKYKLLYWGFAEELVIFKGTERQHSYILYIHKMY